MSLLAGINKATSEIKVEEERLGFTPQPTGVYDAEVVMAYLIKSKGGALGLSYNLKTSEGEIRCDTEYFTSGDAKGNKNYFERTDSKTKVTTQHYLPGYNKVNALCLLTTNKSIEEQETAERVVSKWNGTAEEPTTVEALVDLIGSTVKVTVLDKTVDKQKANAAGVYENTGEKRRFNEVTGFYHPTSERSLFEVMNDKDPVQLTKWRERYGTAPVDTSTGVEGGAKGSSAKQAPAKALFS